jgi:hypothetical protein
VHILSPSNWKSFGTLWWVIIRFNYKHQTEKENSYTVSGNLIMSLDALHRPAPVRHWQ